MKRCPKCGSVRFNATAHVTQDWEIDQNGNFIKSLDNCVEVTHFPNDEDVWDCANCGYSAAGSDFEVSEGTKMRYEKTLFVSARMAKTINHYLHDEPEDEADCFGEDEVISFVSKFGNDVEIQIKCCGVQFKEGESNLAWTEAVLFDNGSQICCTEPEDEFFGEWILEYNGDEYVVHVEVGEEPEEK